jgi:hypothetical protein
MRGGTVPGIHSRVRRVVAVAVVAVTSAVVALPPVAVSADKDCKDFDSRKQAQRFFENHNPKKDPHNLDADDDGKACEDYDY